MAKKMDVLKQFETLHRQLVQEREEIRARVDALNQALGNGHVPVQNLSSIPASFPGTFASSARDLGMREAIQQAVRAQPLGVRDIVVAIEQLGFRFKSKNPYNSVGAYLYGKEGRKYFSKADGKFSALAQSPASPKPGGRRKRKLSAAGRRAIALAARKRWAKYNAEKRKG